MKRLIFGLAGLALLLEGVGQTRASQIFATSYDMPNGDGTAHGGTFNYWDGNYNGTGNKTTDQAPLSGGLGALTDGTLATQYWFPVSSLAGTGPYVGWTSAHGGSNPTITFHFAGVQNFSQVMIHFDDSHQGGVAPPSSITINGQNFTVTDPNSPGGVPAWINLFPVNLSANALSVTLNINTSLGYTWVFSDEMEFFGTAAATPEPAALTLFGIGIACMAGYGWRRKKLAAA
jgi:hypothetical protein